MNASAVHPLHLTEQRVPGTPPSLAAPRRVPIATEGAPGQLDEAVHVGYAAG
ncbi:MAG: hypothetical protein IH787_00915 [Nitrospirae bacterium]|nr:hypothetical protein [Nitrospirota bacterium]